MTSANEIRQRFIDYFVERHGHTFVPSAPLPVPDDPTLMFMNSGMVQFKDVFLGTGSRPYTRAANTQKCLRVSGKHNDLEDVGRDTYHHTFFEMLGNWSFGDYFKREAIAWAWDLLTNVWGLEKDRLHATFFEGSEAEGLERDDEAARLWTEVTDIDPSHVHAFDRKDNFWEMGEVGPCGPCSEIHVDLTPDRSGASLVNADDPRVIEIWNLVFIQFNRNTDGSLTPLPAKHVDTGMGFERICAVLQGKTSNYDTDLFTPIFSSLRDLAGAPPYGASLEGRTDIAYRVIADHLRCLTFSITDGVIPSNEAEGYVLRRVLRRAVRHGRQTMGITEPFLHRLVPTVVDLMGDAFPELKRNAQGVMDVIQSEEESFARTLDRGIELFERVASAQRDEGSNQIPGDDAFRLHDTYGFPLDLTQVMADERGMTVDIEGFQRLMTDARELSRAAGGKADVTTSLVEIVQREALPKTEFRGYTETASSVASPARVLRIAEGAAYELLPEASEGERVAVVLQATPFYAEAGGQVGDTGVIEWASGRMRVDDTQKQGDVYFHLGVVSDGALRSSEEPQQLTLRVDEPRRAAILGNHTGTHMMNLALRKVLGMHVEQKGSLVDDDKLRFDLSHPGAITTDEIGRVEEHVRADIVKDLTVHDDVVPLQDALQIRNLRAVFGEKYPQMIRVVSIGVPVTDLLERPDDPAWDDYSIELCGGTHLAKSGEAGTFTIVHEEAVAKGIRRVVALTGGPGRAAVERGRELLSRAEALVSAGPGELAAGVTELNEALTADAIPAVVRAELRSRLAELQRRVKEQDRERGRERSGEVVELILEIASAAAGPVAVGSLEGVEAGVLRSAVEAARGRIGEQAILVGSVDGDKVSLVAAVPSSLVERGLAAGEWVREAAAAASGRGGGKPDIAQAGARDPSKLPDALEAARRYAEQRLGS